MGLELNLCMQKKYFEHETVKSFRLYFGLAGFVGLYSYATSLWGVATGTTTSVTTLLSELFGLLASAGFIYFTYTLPTYLRSGNMWILKAFISTLFGVSIVWNVFGDISGTDTLGLWGLLISLPLGLFFWWYFYQTIDRLSKENK